MDETLERYQPPELVHVSLPEDGSETFCGERAPRRVISSVDVWAPIGPHFTCGACHKVMAGGVEPMGGSLYLAEAHGAGA